MKKVQLVKHNLKYAEQIHTYSSAAPVNKPKKLPILKEKAILQ